MIRCRSGSGLILGCVLLAGAFPALAADSEPGAPGAIVASPNASASASASAASTVDALREARFSLQLKNAPLLQMLWLLSASTPVRFRFGTPPDALVSTALQEAPLLPTLDNLLHALGFQTRREQVTLWLFSQNAPAQPIAPAVQDAPEIGRREKTTLVERASQENMAPRSWQIWTRPTPPPPRWMEPAIIPSNANKTSTRWTRSAQDAATGVGWMPVPLTWEAEHRPGVSVPDPARWIKNSSGESCYLRWPLRLRRVPRGAQLLLESHEEATLFVNGAPVLRRFQGRRLIDLSDVLQPGENCLAIEARRPLPVVPPPTTPAPVAEATPPVVKTAKTEVPLLRYEWFFAAGE